MKTLISFVVAFMVGVMIAVVGAFPTEWAVNYVFSSSTILAVFGVAKLTFAKAVWLNLLGSMLFKGVTEVKS